MCVLSRPKLNFGGFLSFSLFKLENHDNVLTFDRSLTQYQASFVWFCFCIWKGFGTQLLSRVCVLYPKFPFIKLQYAIKFWEFENQNQTWEINSSHGGPWLHSSCCCCLLALATLHTWATSSKIPRAKLCLELRFPEFFFLLCLGLASVQFSSSTTSQVYPTHFVATQVH
jgi:hypothetical protein